MNRKRRTLEVMLRIMRLKLQQHELDHAEAVRSRAAEKGRLEALIEDFARTRALVVSASERGPIAGGELAGLHERLGRLARSLKEQAAAVDESEKRVEEAKRLLTGMHRQVKSLETLEAKLKRAAEKERARSEGRHVELVLLSKQVREGG